MLVVLGVIESIENDEQRLLIEKLYRKYSGWVLKTAYDIVQDYDAAQDILNDTFIRLIQYADVVMELEEYKIGSYVKQIVQSCAYTYLAKESKEREKTEKWLEMNGTAESVDFDAGKLLDYEDLYQAMDKLDERDRSLLISKYGFCLNHREIGAMYSLPARNVSMYVIRAKNRLKELLKREMR